MQCALGNRRHRMEEMGSGGGLAGGDFGMVRVVAVHADLPSNWAGGPVPVTAGAAVGASFPVPISRSVATAAKRRAFRQLDMPPVASLQQLQVLVVVAVETVVIPVVRPMAHHNVFMFLRDNDILLRIEPQNRWLALLMAGIAIKVREVCFGANQLGVRLPDGRRGQELGVNQGNLIGQS